MYTLFIYLQFSPSLHFCHNGAFTCYVMLHGILTLIQCFLASPAICNPPKNTLGTNGGGLTRSDLFEVRPGPLLMLPSFYLYWTKGNIDDKAKQLLWTLKYLNGNFSNIYFCPDSIFLDRINFLPIHSFHVHPTGVKC